MLLEKNELYRVVKGDCITGMAEMPDKCVDMSVFSPPFVSLYAYTSSPSDIGNSEGFNGEAKLHMSFFYKQLARIMKPGRVVVVHVAQVIRMKRSGGRGMYDFRGWNIRLAERAGLIFDYDWLIRKPPQAQAVRTKSHQLQFAGLERDRAQSRGAMGDYLLKFISPGDNAVPIDSKEVTRNEWIDWAEPCWNNIRESDTLNREEARGPEDTKHICPLQLQVIERVVRLYSNPGEIVYSPFTGMGSELYIAVKHGRRAFGHELKDEYHAAALMNLRRAEQEAKDANKDLFQLCDA